MDEPDVAPKSAPMDRAGRPGPLARKLLILGIFGVLFAALGIGIYGLVDTHGRNLADAASYLPRQQVDQPVNKTLVGTVADPALTVEGDDVEVRTPDFSVLAVVSGPVVPGEGLPNQMRFTTCTWTISLSHVVGTVPIAVADFDSIDHAGTVYKPAIVPGQPALPAFLHSGQKYSFQVRSVMPVGEGLFRWAPDGDHIVAKWDYQVEND